MNKALIIVDMQNDFCFGGHAMPRGEEVVEPLNKLIRHAKENGWIVVASRDWHPESETHCVRNTKGAEFHPGLQVDDNFIFVLKGEHDISGRSYSAFNGENINLKQVLENENVGEVFIGGLAADYCVKNTAIDAAKCGFKTNVVWDATRGVYKKTNEEETKRMLIDNGVSIVKLESVVV